MPCSKKNLSGHKQGWTIPLPETIDRKTARGRDHRQTNMTAGNRGEFRRETSRRREVVILLIMSLIAAASWPKIATVSQPCCSAST
jgi:hypothetical protein